MHFAIDLPNDFIAVQGEHQVQKEMRISYALWLYQQARITLSKAAQLAGVDIYDFMSICKAHQLPTINMSPEELAQELAGLSST